MRLEDLARLRQLAYRLLSSALLYPDKKRWETLAAAAWELKGASHAMVQFDFFPRWDRFLTSLADLPNHPAPEEEYVRVFMHSSESASCLPYESVFIAPGGQATGWMLALLEQEYAVAGLALSPSLKDLPDHISVELEFMAFLCGQETDAWSGRAAEKGVQALERQAAFLNKHLCRWVPGWAQHVADADGEGIYSVVAETASAFLCHDQDLIRVLLDKSRTILATAQNPKSRATLRSHRRDQ